MYLVIASYLPSANSYAQGFGTVSAITDFTTATKNTGKKPQSKVWKHDGIWWAVIPTSSEPAGTYIYKLVGTTWVKEISLSVLTEFFADTKNVGDITYILLFKSGTSQFVTVTYSSGTQTYSVTAKTNIPMSGVETATIDIDSEGRMWLAYERINDIRVKWSDFPYSTWNGPLVLESSVDNDDIAAVTAFNDDDAGEKIGVMWSDQKGTDKFRFAYHVDGDGTLLSDWTLETAVSDNKVADDHINFAVATDGTIYAAVKTSFETGGEPQVALLVRRPNGTWDPLYSVRDRDGGEGRTPTRPIALLDETNNIITVVYTQAENGNDIVYKSSSTGSIDFSSGDDGLLLISNASPNPDWNNVTSTFTVFSCFVVFLLFRRGLRL